MRSSLVNVTIPHSHARLLYVTPSNLRLSVTEVFCWQLVQIILTHAKDFFKLLYPAVVGVYRGFFKFAVMESGIPCHIKQFSKTFCGHSYVTIFTVE